MNRNLFRLMFLVHTSMYSVGGVLFRYSSESQKMCGTTTLKLLLIAATNFSDFSEKPHNREIKYAHYFVLCINFV